ncbi:nucleotidyl transferase AbiEii/AbiGii toxin family protein [Saccharopolyspora endophytica]|uniref:nucleotidyl transferase AbiEii/AbiGii toxin family protein n=1 Tax=Saccharopolyspora endophytica TaxID=543886 RepID=UPI003556159A
MRVPTLESFAAWKTAAWVDRRAARDLYDLWLLSEIGALNATAAELFRKNGPTNKPPTTKQFSTHPDEVVWESELAGQTRRECPDLCVWGGDPTGWKRPLSAGRGSS